MAEVRFLWLMTRLYPSFPDDKLIYTTGFTAKLLLVMKRKRKAKLFVFVPLREHLSLVGVLLPLGGYMFSLVVENIWWFILLFMADVYCQLFCQELVYRPGERP